MLESVLLPFRGEVCQSHCQWTSVGVHTRPGWGPGECFIKRMALPWSSENGWHVRDGQGKRAFSVYGRRPGKGLGGAVSVIFEEEQIFLFGLEYRF